MKLTKKLLTTAILAISAMTVSSVSYANKSDRTKKALEAEIYWELASDNYSREDYGRAYEWGLKAAKMNNSNAQAMMGGMHLYGLGVKKNFPEGLKWLQKSVKQGNRKGEVILAMAYHNGLGVKQNVSKARKLYQSSCKKGEAQACEILRKYFN